MILELPADKNTVNQCRVQWKFCQSKAHWVLLECGRRYSLSSGERLVILAFREHLDTWLFTQDTGHTSQGACLQALYTFLFFTNSNQNIDPQTITPTNNKEISPIPKWLKRHIWDSSHVPSIAQINSFVELIFLFVLFSLFGGFWVNCSSLCNYITSKLHIIGICYSAVIKSHIMATTWELIKHVAFFIPKKSTFLTRSVGETNANCYVE